MDDVLSWIAVDWGTSRFRAYAVSKAGRVLGSRVSDNGMARLQPSEFEATLLAEISPWLASDPVLVLACGMVGARQGWVEVPYAKIGTDLASLIPMRVPTQDPRLDVQIVPGLCQADPADVMRGEEMQIAGFLADMPDFIGTLCLPGTHSKWCKVENGRLIGFRTLIVGELFELLFKHSLLRHSVGDGWDEEVFRASVADVVLHGADPLALLFTIRAEGLLAGMSNAVATARLSGLLIGAELCAARHASSDAEVVIIGAEDHCARYATALAVTGTKTRMFNGDALVVKGLAQLARKLSSCAPVAV